VRASWCALGFDAAARAQTELAVGRGEALGQIFASLLRLDGAGAAW
jgi:hypothetical protein